LGRLCIRPSVIFISGFPDFHIYIIIYLIWTSRGQKKKKKRKGKEKKKHAPLSIERKEGALPIFRVFQMNFVKQLNKGYMKFVDEDKLKQYINRGFNIDDMWFYTTEYLRKLQLKFPNKDAEVYEVLNYDDIQILSDVMYNQGKVQAGAKARDMLKDHNIDEALIDAFIKRLWSMLTNPDDFLKYKDIEAEWDDSCHTFVQFHMKKQPKEVRTPGYDGIFKAGQGVSAWSKMYNIMISGMIRYFSYIMTHSDKEYIQNSYGLSDKDLSAQVKKMAGHTVKNNNIKKVVNDFSEFDSAQDEVSILAFAFYLRKLNFPDKIIRFYVKLRLRWNMALRSSCLGVQTITILKGTEKKHSGEPATLDGNTWFNKAVIGVCVNIVNPYFLGFKGDDCIMIADEVVIVRKGLTTMWQYLGYKFKINFVKYAEYIANIITPEGFYPDLIRRASRVISKIYSDKADWDEIRQSTADALAVIPNGYSDMGNKFLVQHYKEQHIMITEHDCDVLRKFLQDVVVNDAHEPTDIEQYYQHVAN